MFTNTQSLSFCVFSDSWTHSFHSLLLYSFILCLLYLIIAHTPFCVILTQTHAHTCKMVPTTSLCLYALSLSLLFIHSVHPYWTDNFYEGLFVFSLRICTFLQQLTFLCFCCCSKKNFLYFLFYILCWNNFRLAI